MGLISKSFCAFIEITWIVCYMDDYPSILVFQGFCCSSAVFDVFILFAVIVCSSIELTMSIVMIMQSLDLCGLPLCCAVAPLCLLAVYL